MSRPDISAQKTLPAMNPSTSSSSAPSSSLHRHSGTRKRSRSRSRSRSPPPTANTPDSQQPPEHQPAKDLSKALVLRSPKPLPLSPSRTPSPARSAPLLAKRRAADQSDFDSELATLPDHCPTATYETMPIVDFGLAMLRSMGWQDGDGIGRGRNKKGAEVKPIQYIPRPGRLGLGAQPVPEGEEDAGPVYELPVTKMEIKVRKSLGVKSLVEITGGRHAGMLGVVKELMFNKEVARVELAANGDWVKVEAVDIRVLDEQDTNASGSSKVWVRPGLLVRIISKSLDGGRHYLRKGRIIDVLPGGVCVLEVDDSRRTLLDRVSQDDLETVVPSVRDQVCIVYLPRKLRNDKPYLLGMRGEVTEKDKKNQEVVVMTVEDEVVVCHFDHVCAVARGGR
ncbi:DExH-box splicing factor binding site-domain-containing protein [Catenaria anguillulae PL171]|uniref:DExH-box splicing factor binding site-domain-containing protein n=1 Tax=Catenaria anguillulae PL171 TaxID=765915 RepID=A0A1Y2HXS8_9FUNG|nr:DExH-box splicing factor binding site-domain-containing protein [Catenaria anguillulae PL171]